MTAVLLTQVLCDGRSAPTTRPRLFVGSFHVVAMHPDASISYVAMVCGGVENDDNASIWAAARVAARAVIMAGGAAFLVAESLDDIANLCDARTLRK